MEGKDFGGCIIQETGKSVYWILRQVECIAWRNCSTRGSKEYSKLIIKLFWVLKGY